MTTNRTPIENRLINVETGRKILELLNIPCSALTGRVKTKLGLKSVEQIGAIVNEIVDDEVKAAAHFLG